MTSQRREEKGLNQVDGGAELVQRLFTQEELKAN